MVRHAGGVSTFDGKRWESYTVEDGLAGNRVNEMVMAPGCVLWMASGFTSVGAVDGQWGFIGSIGLDLLGRIWIGAREFAAYYDGKGWTTAFWMEVVAPSLIITTMAAGPDGSMWFGTTTYEEKEGHGAIRCKDGMIGMYRRDDGLASNNVLSIVLGPDGAMWLGPPTGISRFEWNTMATGKFYLFMVPTGIPVGIDPKCSSVIIRFNSISFGAG
jgi:ligand-binding sensor domain-containing protein